MKFFNFYNSPIGTIIVVSDGENLTNLYFASSSKANAMDLTLVKKDLPIFDETFKWLDIYFKGENPTFTPKCKINNITPFKELVFKILENIPHGQTISYKEIADKIARQKGLKKMSAQAVGMAVGSNPICIIIPCHRVIGSNGNMIGYSGGIANKIKLLQFEKCEH